MALGVRAALVLAALTALAAPAPPAHASSSSPCDVPLASAALRAAYAGAPATWPAPCVDADVAYVELGPAPAPPAPAAALRTQGARLVADRRLSRDGDVACLDCHHPAHGWTLAHAVGRGSRGQAGRRNPPSWLNAAAALPDAQALAAAALAPLTDAHEMGPQTLAEAATRVSLSGGDDPARALGEPLAAYLQGLAQPSRVDRFLSGDGRSLSDVELHGLHLFRTRARCANCHHGPQLTDGRFHNLGLSFFGEPAQDLGQYERSGLPDDVGRFRTPSLRHVSRTAPYMHHGLFTSLRGVLHFYQRGGGEVRARNAREAAHPLYPWAARLSPQLRPLSLDAAEVEALLAFLQAL